MGSFRGHLSPGLYCAIMGLWYMINASCRYVTCRKFNVPYRSSYWFLWNRFSKIPLEPLMSFIVFSTDSTMQLYDSAVLEEEFVWGNIQHMNIYILIVVVSAAQLYQFIKGQLIFGFDYFCYSLVFLATALELYYHLHGRQPVDVMLHMLVIYSAMAIVVILLLELAYNTSPLLTMVRGMAYVLLGLNLIHTGFIVYPPGGGIPMDLKHHNSMTKVNVLFGFELAFIPILAMVIHIIVLNVYPGDNVYLKAIRNSGHGKQENGHKKELHPPEYSALQHTFSDNIHKLTV